MQLFYIDASVLVTPLLKNRPQPIIDECLSWLERIGRGELRGVTSFLTWDEVTWIAAKQPTGKYVRADAVAAGQRLLGLVNFEFVPADTAVTHKAQDLLARFNFKPRDSIHASSALLHAGGSMLTLDSDFLKNPVEASKLGLKVVQIGGGSPP
ncbi:MAG TPA: type II toxin-antitoxin system VapC family toxin [Myxococcaceae bacterium]|nr:type II toxin-antitoxin system VapC family toxin [Myxococcaceae bacterium]